MHNWVDKWVANCKSHWSISTVIDNGGDVTTETTGWGSGIDIDRFCFVKNKTEDEPTMFEEDE